jgi:hypothetical protein
MTREDWPEVKGLLNTQFNIHGLKELRREFPEDKVGKLPRWDKKKGEEIFLDYVGHATVTQRLLDVDPFWNWEAMLTRPDGSIVFDVQGDSRVGLWIKLTILGVTRLGYGSVTPGTRDEVKQLIGDAIRNAAMRFGVATSLWEKHREEEDVKDRDNGDVDTGPAVELSCELCGACFPSTGLRVIPSGFDNAKTRVAKGDPVLNCPECGKWTPRQEAPKTNGEEEKKPPKEFAPGHEMKRTKAGVMCHCGLEFEETEDAKLHWEKTLKAHKDAEEKKKQEAEAGPAEGQGDLDLGPDPDDDLPF